MSPTIVNSPHNSECIKPWHVLIRLAARYHLPKNYTKTGGIESNKVLVKHGICMLEVLFASLFLCLFAWNFDHRCTFFFSYQAIQSYWHLMLWHYCTVSFLLGHFLSCVVWCIVTPFSNTMKTVKSVVSCFAAVSHLGGPLRKQKCTSTGWRGHGYI